MTMNHGFFSEPLTLAALVARVLEVRQRTDPGLIPEPPAVAVGVLSVASLRDSLVERYGVKLVPADQSPPTSHLFGMRVVERHDLQPGEFRLMSPREVEEWFPVE